jgi:hypothetical protein
LHSSDPLLTGRLHEGVHDLVGSLTHAGYDAEAWTPGQQRQNRDQTPPPRKRPNGPSAATQDFAGLLQNTKETS